MKSVGKRKEASGWKAIDALQKLATELRKGAPLYPKGVHKFKTHEAAQEWAEKMKNPKSRASRR